MKVRVRCSFTLEVDLPEDYEFGDCWYTGRLGAAFDEAMRHAERSRTCPCNLDCECKIIGPRASSDA